MSKTYLDKTGAAYLVGKIWEYVRGKMRNSGVLLGKKNSDTSGSGGDNVYIIGYNNVAKSYYTFGFGHDLISQYPSQYVFGHYNEECTADFVFGSGTSTARKNALKMTNSSAVFSGKLYSGKFTTDAQIPTQSDLASLIKIDESTGDIYITY